ncbi:MAG: M14 family metallopeptidase, partial [Sphingomonadales bacterium]
GFEAAEGLEIDADRLAAEHDELWPSGRMNHYLFDLNRDWFALSQPETRGRVKVLQDWFPLAYVDAHEMGSDATYYFAPEAIPYNPHLAKDQRDSLTLFGQNHAKWFDKFGFDYFTREVFDAFYPGYGASWPSYFGSVAMTYEQASSRGLKMRRYDGKEFHYRDTVRHHFVTSVSTAEVVAANREKFLREFYAYRKSAIAEGSRGKIQTYIIPTVGDRSAADKMVGVLVTQGVEVMEATSPFRVCRIQYKAGSYVISLAQPAKRLIRTLMDADVPMEKAFVSEQERRRAKKLPDEIYDVTAWSLPAMYNVRTDACGAAVSGNFKPRGPEWIRPGKLSGAGASVAYMVPWGSIASTRLLAGALRQGLDVKSSDKPFTMAGREFPGGTLIFKVDENPEDLEELLRGLAETSGADVVGTSDSWVTKGPNFGSRNVVSMVPPKVAIAWDMPTHPYSAGNSRFVIEHQIGYPVTPIRARRLATADLSRYQVLILPEIAPFFGGDYAKTLGKKGTENLKRWVANGGTLILFGNAMRYAADPNVDLIAVRREDAFRKKAPGKGAEKGEKPKPPSMPMMMAGKKKKPPTVPGKLIENAEALKKAVQPKKGPPDSVAGILALARIDSDHWMAAGLARELKVLVRGPDIYTPIKLDKGVNVVHFAGADELLVSGYMWRENRAQLAYKPFVVAQRSGRGYVIGFTQDPTVRAYLDGLNVVLANAIFRGAAHARPVR